MLEWECRQKHDEDRMAAHRETGFVDDQRRIRQYNGKAYWKHFEANGHDSSEFARCKCKEAIDE